MRKLYRTLTASPFTTALLLFVFTLGAPSESCAGPITYSATGSTQAELLPTMNQFRTDISLGGGNNGDLAGPFLTGRREVNWDDVPAGANRWANGRSRGIIPGWFGGVDISSHPLSPSDPNRNFGNINPG